MKITPLAIRYQYKPLAKKQNFQNKKQDVKTSCPLPFFCPLVSFGAAKPMPIWAIPSDGEPIRFNTRQELMNYFEISYAKFSQVFRNENAQFEGYAFIDSNKVELKDKKGNPIADKDGNYMLDWDEVNKIRENLSSSDCKKIPKASQKQNQEFPGVYVLNYDGTYQKYPNLEIATVSVADKNHYDAFRGALHRKNAIDGHIILYAYEVEYKDKNGEIKVDKDKITEALSGFDRGYNRPFYIIEPDGTYKRHLPLKETPALDYDFISRLLRTKKVVKGQAAVYASDFEIRDENGRLLLDKDGNPQVNQEALKKVLGRMILDSAMLLSVSKNKKIQIHTSFGQAAEDTGLARVTVAEHLSNGPSKHARYIFFYLRDVVVKDINGDLILDENNRYIIDMLKLNQAFKSQFGRELI